MKLTKHEKESIKRSMNLPKDRGETWVGIRPCVFKDKKKDKKTRRRSGKNLCRKAEVFDDLYFEFTISLY